MRPRVLIYFGLLWALSLARAENPIALPAADRAWLSLHPSIRVGYDPDWPPFTFHSQDGHLIGIDADVLALLSRRLGVKFEIVSSPDWDTAYSDARQRRTDMLLSTVPTPARVTYFKFSAAYLTFPLAIISRDDNNSANWAMADLDNKRVAVVTNYAVSSRMRAQAPHATLVWESSVAEALQAVADNQADAALTNLANATFLIQTKGYTNLRVVGLAPNNSDLRYAVRSDWPELLDILNRGIATLTSQDFRAINDRWIQIRYTPGVRWDLIWKIGGSALLAIIILVAAVGYHNRRLARELSARIRLQSEVERTRDELKRLNEDKGWLMEMAAHDLRSPLTAMQLLADLSLKQGAMPAVDALSRLEPHIQRMLNLLNHLFNVHAIEEGRQPVASRPVDAGEIVATVIRSVQGAAAAKEIRVEASGLHTKQLALGDEVAIRQVAENLISNALKYSPTGGKVDVALRKLDGAIRLEVRDHGPGVPESERDRIFVKYARGSALPTGGERSTGLGLAIVRSLVNAMQGRIWCEAADPGARFIVVLKAA